MPVDVPLPDLVEPLRSLLGTWHGEGVGAVPGGGGPDFPYVEELTLACDGSPWLTYTTRAMSPITGAVLHAEAGWWRPQPRDGDGPVPLEIVLTTPTGVAEVLIAECTQGPAGLKVEAASDVVARTPTAPPVTADKRLYAVRAGKLMYAIDLAAADGPLAPHLAAALDPLLPPPLPPV